MRLLLNACGDTPESARLACAPDLGSGVELTADPANLLRYSARSWRPRWGSCRTGSAKSGGRRA
ncbi:MAG: hypothetical protein EXR71_10640 [Myxococcales bacterium]|nr:hypothetical protein [Myxococcales bacterium]